MTMNSGAAEERRWIGRITSARSRCHVAAAALLLLIAAGSTAFAQDDAAFSRANDEYAGGQFQDAVRDYESLVQAGQFSAALFYNLGNAYFRSHDLGRAILNYERALALEPQHAESVANLALARDEARALELRRDRSDFLLQHLTPNQLTVTAAIAFWVTVFSVVAIMFQRRRSVIPGAIATLGCLILAGSLLALYRLETFQIYLAVVTAPEVQARLATADNAKSVLQLPAGSEIRLLSKRGDWTYALLPNDLRGWIPTSSAEPVRL